MRNRFQCWCDCILQECLADPQLFFLCIFFLFFLLIVFAVWVVCTALQTQHDKITTPSVVMVGAYVTSLDMNGVSLSLLPLDSDGLFQVRRHFVVFPFHCLLSFHCCSVLNAPAAIFLLLAFDKCFVAIYAASQKALLHPVTADGWTAAKPFHPSSCEDCSVPSAILASTRVPNTASKNSDALLSSTARSRLQRALAHLEEQVSTKLDEWDAIVGDGDCGRTVAKGARVSERVVHGCE